MTDPNPNKALNPEEYQTIEVPGGPAYVLVPKDEWNQIQHLVYADQSRTNGIPKEVLEAHMLRKESLVKAWREYLSITQQELADRMKVSQAAVAKFERKDARLRLATIKKIATALELKKEQLMAGHHLGVR